MNIGIIYFSGTGNTKFIAENIKVILNKKSISSEIINIEDNRPLDTAKYDSIIIGGPVYVERYPEILLKYIEKELKGYQNKCMLFTTQSYQRATATFQHFINRFNKLKVTYCELIQMPNNFYNFMFSKASKEDEDKLIKQAILTIEAAVNEFIQGKTRFYPEKKGLVVTYNMIYHLFYPLCTKLITSKIKIDKSKCIGCKLCEKNCPTKCIKIGENVSFNNKCLLCQRCMNSCPKDAFLYKNKVYIQYRPDLKKETILTKIK